MDIRTSTSKSRDTQRTLGDLAVTRAGASRVFHSLGLDFCCHGDRSLAQACADKGLEPSKVLDAIEREDTPVADVSVWKQKPIGDLLDFIVGHYHERLRREIPELIAMARKVESVHADKPACPRGLAAHLEAVHTAVLDHLMKEEQILFPMIRAGRGRMAAAPIQVMEMEHEDHGQSLARTRAIAADFLAPEEACGTWRSLYLRLEALEAELMDHIALENHVLFPRTLCE
jgi:regulator of cell morphogenesis and NO signaling